MKFVNQLFEYQYFGSVVNFIWAYNSKYVILEQCESYQKMSFRNRCQVLGSGKVIDLSVPLLGGRDQKALITEVEIDNEQPWQTIHWRTIESCYNKSPFFFYYADEFKSVLNGGYLRLCELDLASLKWALSKLGGGIEIGFSREFQKSPSAEIADRRNTSRPSNRKQFKLKPYQQVFGQVFESNLSILDLLFNLGPQTGDYLQEHIRLI